MASIGGRATRLQIHVCSLSRCVVPGTRSLGQTFKTCRQTSRKRTPRGLLRGDYQFVRIERARYYQLFQIEAAGFRDEEGAESGEGVGYAASKEGPGESAIFAQASDEQWSQGAE